MGVDIEIKFFPKEELTNQDIKELQYNLMHRCGKNFFWLAEDKSDFISKVGEDTDYDYEPHGGYVVGSLMRYYGPGYERGDAKSIVTCLLYLISLDYKVYYGGDSGDSLDLYTKEDVLKLQDHFIKNGNFPYQQYSSRLFEGEPVPPLCSYCNVPMNRYGWGATYAAYSCLGCDEDKTYRDDTFKELVPA